MGDFARNQQPPRFDQLNMLIMAESRQMRLLGAQETIGKISRTDISDNRSAPN